MTTPRQDRILVLLSRRNRMSTARALEIDFRRATTVHLSDQTVINRLHEDGMRARRPARGPILTAQHRVQRLNFAHEYQNWQLRHWRPVLFTQRAGSLFRLTIDLLGCGDVRENVTSTVTLLKLTGTVEAQ